MNTLSLDELDTELAGLKPKKKKKSDLSEEDKRVIAGYEDILRFFRRNGRIPVYSDQTDILERCLAIRLNVLRNNADYRKLLKPFDEQGILDKTASESVKAISDMTDDELAAELADLNTISELTELKHVRSMEARRQSADWVANRQQCQDFERYRILFDSVKKELKDGTRRYYSLDSLKNEQIEAGNFYVIEGQMLYIASVSNTFPSKQEKIKNRSDARAYVIYDNGMENYPLVSTIRRMTYDDKGARGITENDPGPLFAASHDPAVDGTIYVLRSLSTAPSIAQNRNLIHKIGVTTGRVETRIAAAKDDPTYLLAEVEVVASYDLKGIRPVKLENLLHRIFSRAQLDIEIPDRFGKPVRPREWFLVPLSEIDRAIDLIREEKVEGLTYNPQTASLEYLELKRGK